MKEVIIGLLSVNVTTMQESHSYARELKIGWFDYRKDNTVRKIRQLRRREAYTSMRQFSTSTQPLSGS